MIRLIIHVQGLYIYNRSIALNKEKCSVTVTFITQFQLEGKIDAYLNRSWVRDESASPLILLTAPTIDEGITLNLHVHEWTFRKCCSHAIYGSKYPYDQIDSIIIISSSCCVVVVLLFNKYRALYVSAVSWRLGLAKKEMLTPVGHLFSPVLSRDA